MKTKLYFLLILFLGCTTMAMAQVKSNIQTPTSINDNGADPDNSAILDVQSTNKGILVPRMTTAERNAIASPANGLLVFDLNTSSFWFYSLGSWQNLAGGGGGTGSSIVDADNDTKIQVEESADEDVIRFDVEGIEGMILQKDGPNSVSVGIGTTTPDYPLEVERRGYGIAHTADGIQLATYVDTTYTPVGAWLGTYTNHDLIFYTNDESDGQMTLKTYGNTGIGTNEPDSSAILELSSTNQGFLVTRLTTAQRTSITDPANGLLVYDTDTNSFWYFRDMTWTKLSGSSILEDADMDTKIQVEESVDEDIIRFDLEGSEAYVFGTNANGDATLALPGSNNNIFIGNNAGAANTNTIGSGANTFMGHDAGAANNSGFSNTFIGADAGMSNTTGEYNTFLGEDAGTNLVDGSNNTFIGENAGRDNINGSSNTLIGRFAGQNATGSGNVFLGNSAGEVELGDNKLYIENSNSASPLIYGEFDNNIVRVNGNLDATGRIGIAEPSPAADFHIVQSVSNFPNPTTGGVILGEPSNGEEWQIWNSSNFLSFAWEGTRVAYINNSTGDFVATSDRRLKKDVEPFGSALDRVMQLRPVKYHYNHQKTNARKSQGFIAQDVEQLFPEVVHVDEGGDMRGIAYSKFGVIAVKAIQEQQEIIETLKAENIELKARMDKLEALIKNKD